MKGACNITQHEAIYVHQNSSPSGSFLANHQSTAVVASRIQVRGAPSIGMGNKVILKTTKSNEKRSFVAFENNIKHPISVFAPSSQ